MWGSFSPEVPEGLNNLAPVVQPLPTFDQLRNAAPAEYLDGQPFQNANGTISYFEIAESVKACVLGNV